MSNILPRRYQGVPGFNVDPPPPPTRVVKPVDAVTLRGVRVPLNSDVGYAFITDLSRNKERLFSDQRVCEKYDIPETDWTEITQSKAVRLAVNAEHERRMLNGTAAQESAAKIFTEAPEVLGTILRDNKASPRHRIEASKELRTTAQVGTEPNADVERIHITINMGSDEKLVIDAPVKPTPPRDAPNAEDQW